jgi:hypothetical protein
MADVTTKGIPEAEAALDKLAKAIAAGANKPVYVGTTLFYGRFQERGTRRGVRARRFFERAASATRSAAKRLVAGKLEAGDLLAGLVELARRARTQAASGAPSGRGKLRRSIKVQVGGRLRRG